MDPAEQVLMEAETLQGAMNAVIDRGDSPIQQFYQGAVIFVTGGTGFIGKQLIEKLFRACKIKKIYLLMRSKKGKTMLERLDITLQDPVFDLVREKQPNFAAKLYPVEGDVGAIRLGLDDKDWNTIANEVDIIFHLAATVRFDEKLKLATLINVQGTCELVDLARNCKNLRRLVHVSTAYTHATKELVGKEVLEKFYPAPMPADVIIRMVKTLDENKLDDITQPLIKGWPNTYTFTKAIAEHVIKDATDIPACVVKPPVVVPCHYEPKAGWLDLSGMSGPSGIFLGVGLGVFHAIHVDSSSRLATVPLDYVNNAIIASAWDAEERVKSGDTETPMYIVSNKESLVKWGLYSYQMNYSCQNLESLCAVWFCYLIETKNYLLYRLFTWLLHYIPAYILDAICAVIGKRPKQITSFVKACQKVDKKAAVYDFFLMNDWLFKDNNVKAMIARMSDEDRAIFNCNINEIDFCKFTKIWVVGIRKFIVKDGLIGSRTAHKRQKLFRIGHYIFVVLYAYALWSIACTIFSILKYIASYFLYMFLNC